jgi:hypothetical protein
MRMLLVALAVAGLLALPAATAASAPVTKIALTAAEVGPGYVRHTIPGGNQVQGQVTLDMCGGGYPSEALRTARLQVGFAPPAGAKAQVSNEVVSYAGAGAQQALREVRRHIATCPKTPVPMPEASAPPLRFSFTKLAVSGLLPGAVAVVVRISATVNGRKLSETSVAIYQVKGTILSGVYTAKGPLAEQATVAAHAARASAAKLKRLA